MGQVSLIAAHEIGRATESGHHAAKTVGRGATLQRRLQATQGMGLVAGQSGRHQHVGTQRHGHRMQTRVAILTGQVPHRLTHLQRVAGAGGQRLAHVGQERRGPATRAVGHRHYAARQLGRLLGRRHEGAGANLHIHHQSLQTGRQLLGQNRGGDERNGLDGGRHIARGIDALIGWRQITGLPDDGDPDLLDHLAQQLGGRSRLIAGDGVELIQGAAGMTQATTRDHRHEATTGGHQRPQHQRGDIADPTGGVLIDDGPPEREPGPIQHGAGVAHGTGQGDAFSHGHVVEVDSHRQGRDLPLADALVGDSLNERADLIGR